MRHPENVRIGARSALAVVVALAALTTGCGNRLPHDRVVADATGGGTANQSTEFSAPSAGDQLAGGAAAGTGATNPQAAGQPANDVAAGRPASQSSAGPQVSTGAASGSKGQAAAANGSGSSACTGNEPPVTIGTVAAVSGVVGQATTNGVRAVQAWVSYINARGGVSCHPIKHVVGDDGSDPVRNQSLHRQMVEQQGVVAFVFDASPIADSGSRDYINQAKVPVVGPLGAFDYVYESQYMFPTYGVGKQLVALVAAAAAKYAIPQGKNKVAILTCNEASYCAMADETWAVEAPKLGFDVVSRARAPITQPDFTAQCLAAKNAGAQVILTAFAPEGNKRIAASCENVGLKVIKGVASVQAALDFKDSPPSNETVIGLPVAPWFSTQIAGVKDYQQQLTKYAPSLPFDMQSINGWTGAKHFEAATMNLPAGEVKATDILEGLWKMKGETLGGLAPYPLTFERLKPALRKTCGWLVVLKNGQWTSDGKAFCQ